MVSRLLGVTALVTLAYTAASLWSLPTLTIPETQPTDGPSLLTTNSAMSEVVMSEARPADAVFSHSRTHRGADVDGELAHHDGQLRINRDLRRWMDFHLSVAGEIPLVDVIEYMRVQMQRLPLPASQQALDVLQAYLGYLSDVKNYDELTAQKVQGLDVEALQARLDWMEARRYEYFDDDTVAAFFATDQALDHYTLARLRGEDSASLPTSLQVQRQQARQLNQLATINDVASDPVARFEAREAQFGTAAAERLAALDAQREDWRARLMAYRRYMQQLPEGDDAALEAYRQQHFSAQEQQRLQAALLASGLLE
ncbi:MAG: lipase secretion chaperone [Pseudomonadota bacterium]|nr:lipase secretion chaperone [Pseudomonadota bacterium]